jgi:hypothetical protein
MSMPTSLRRRPIDSAVGLAMMCSGQGVKTLPMMMHAASRMDDQNDYICLMRFR